MLKLIQICTIESIVHKISYWDENITYLQIKAGYVQHIHTRVCVFTRYTSMCAIGAKFKF